MQVDATVYIFVSSSMKKMGSFDENHLLYRVAMTMPFCSLITKPSKVQSFVAGGTGRLSSRHCWSTIRLKNCGSWVFGWKPSIS